MSTKYPRSVCQRNATNVQAICCDSWVHLKCSNLSKLGYDILEQSSDPWVCPSCLSLNLPFSPVINIQGTISKSLFSELFSQLNQYLKNLQENEDNENSEPILPNDCSYINIGELNSRHIKDSNNFALFHLNIASLSLNYFPPPVPALWQELI